jgi:hypothetical protein
MAITAMLTSSESIKLQTLVKDLHSTTLISSSKYRLAASSWKEPAIPCIAIFFIFFLMLKIPDKAGTIYAKYPNNFSAYQFVKITNEPEFSF